MFLFEDVKPFFFATQFGRPEVMKVILRVGSPEWSHMVLEAMKIAEGAICHFYKLKVTLLAGTVVCVVLSTTPRMAEGTVYISEDMSHAEI